MYIYYILQSISFLFFQKIKMLYFTILSIQICFLFIIKFLTSLKPHPGKYLFFTSARNPFFPYPEHNLTYDEIVKIFNSPLNGSYNVYWVDAKVIEKLKPKELQ